MVHQHSLVLEPISTYVSQTSWRIAIRQAWLFGLLDRKWGMAREGIQIRMIFNSYGLTEASKQFVQSPTSCFQWLTVITFQQAKLVL